MATIQTITTISDVRRIVGEWTGSDYYTENPADHTDAVERIATQIRDEAHAVGLRYGQDWSPLFDRVETERAIQWLDGERDAITDCTADPDMPPTESDALAQWRTGNDAGRGYGIGDGYDSPVAAVLREGWQVARLDMEGRVLAVRDGGALVYVADVNGAWAVDLNDE